MLGPRLPFPASLVIALGCGAAAACGGSSSSTGGGECSSDADCPADARCVGERCEAATPDGGDGAAPGEADAGPEPVTEGSEGSEGGETPPPGEGPEGGEGPGDGGATEGAEGHAEGQEGAAEGVEGTEGPEGAEGLEGGDGGEGVEGTEGQEGDAGVAEGAEGTPLPPDCNPPGEPGMCVSSAECADLGPGFFCDVKTSTCRSGHCRCNPCGEGYECVEATGLCKQVAPECTEAAECEAKFGPDFFCASKKCVERKPCAANEDCIWDPRGTRCDLLTGLCEECASHLDCPESSECSHKKKCVREGICMGDGECAGQQWAPYCAEDIGGCVVCTDDTHCTGDRWARFCHPQKYECVECFTDADCAAVGGGYCNGGGRCIQCQTAADCPDPAYPVCETHANEVKHCVECDTYGGGTQCLKHPHGPSCSNRGLCKCDNSLECALFGRTGSCDANEKICK